MGLTIKFLPSGNSAQLRFLCVNDNGWPDKECYKKELNIMKVLEVKGNQFKIRYK